MWASLRRSLTPRRLSYAWLAGGALWLAWLLSIFLGQGQMDLAGQVIGTDYLQFYTAGYTVRTGQSARLYDVAYQMQLEQAIAGPGLSSYHAFITPPFLAWLFVPFSLLPYGASFALWSGLGLAGLWAGIRLLGVLERPNRAFLWALTWFPVFAAISYGQNALLTFFILSLTYWLWCKGRRFAAGLVCSLVMYKPQLLIGVALLWLLSWRRDKNALAGLALGSAGLALLCFWLLPEASWAYVDFSRTTLPDLPNWKDFPLWHLHTVRGFWRLLLPGYPIVADVAWLLLSAVGVGAFVRFWRRWQGRAELSFAAAVCLSLWITPHAMIYDWALLLIPALLLWMGGPPPRIDWQILFAIVWVAAFLSDPLTFLQYQAWRWAFQASVPVLGWVLHRAYRWLMASDPGA